MQPRLSVVVPMYNEAAVLPLFLAEVRAALDGLAVSYELICVDDGSDDSTAELVQAVSSSWPQIRLVRLLRNSGHQAALTAGYERARGDYVVTMDADLQDPPTLISEMLHVAEAHTADVVYAVREDRSTDTVMKRGTARAYYRVMRRVAGGQVPMDAGDFRLVSRRVVKALSQIPPHNRVYRLIIPWFGFPAEEVRYQRGLRAAGVTKYPLRKMMALAIDSVTSFSAAPLRVATYAGVAGVLVCLLAMAVSLAAWFSDNTVPGWTSTVATVGLIGAIQLICVGLLGEYMARLFIAGQGRPTYVVGYDSLDEMSLKPLAPEQRAIPLAAPREEAPAQWR